MTDPNFRIAYCIICHKYTLVLQELVDRLSLAGGDLLLHVDGKVSLTEFEPLRGKVRFVEPRIKVRWGHVSQIECMLSLFDATRQSNYHYIVLLSGDTLPLRSSREIRDFLSNAYHTHTEYIRSFCDERRTRRRLQRMHYLITRKEDRTPMWLLKYALLKCFRRSRNPLYASLPPMETGSGWIAFSDHFRDYIFTYLDKHPDYLRAFRYSSCGDEVFFQTIMLNSPFAANNTRHGIMYVDWDNPASSCSPRTLSTNDLERLAAFRTTCEPDKPFLFARKIADQIDLEQYRNIIPNQ